jgi:hypothetical protein
VLACCYCDRITEIINLKGRKVYFQRFQSLVAWPHCFGPVVGHDGGNMWQSKAVHLMLET